MLNTSFEFDRKIGNNTKVMLRAHLYTQNMSTSMLYGDDILMEGMSFTASTSSSSSFDIGSVISSQFKISLNNADGRFDEYDFTGAVIRPEIGMSLEDGSIEWIKKGVYWIDQPDSYSASIELTALDGLSLLDSPYSEISTHYPATLRTIVTDICTNKGLELELSHFQNDNYTVSVRPEKDMTCRDVLSYVAQIAGCYVTCSNTGTINFKWYDTGAFEREDWADGGQYNGPGDQSSSQYPYVSGDKISGGNFNDYTTGDTLDGGELKKRDFALVSGISTASVCTDDVVITGISVTAQDEIVEEDSNDEGNDGETYLSGEEGYILNIADNPFIEYGKAETVANMLATSIVGMRFRPFQATVIGNPSWEVGDPCLIISQANNIYRSFFTQLTYKPGAYASVACNAETPARHSASAAAAATSPIVQIRKEMKREKTAREIALRDLAEKLKANKGVFMTIEDAEDGGKIYYMHDKPTLAESKVVWKMTADVIAVSTDGVDNYSYFLDASGTAILDRIYAIGLDADYIRSGALQVKKGEDALFTADFDTGEVFINSSSVFTGDKYTKIAYLSITGSWRVRSGTNLSSNGIAYVASAIYEDGKGHNPYDFEYFVLSFPERSMKMDPAVSYPMMQDGIVALEIKQPNDMTTLVPLYDAKGIKLTETTSTSRLGDWSKDGEAYFKKDSSIFAKFCECESVPGNKGLATSSELKVVKDQILLKVSKGDVSSQISVESGAVDIKSNRFSWESTYSSLTNTGELTCTKGNIGGFTINDTSIYNDLMTLDSNGLYLKRGNTNVGKIGTNAMVHDSSIKGLVFDLEASCHYMSWNSKKSSSDTNYSIRLLYANRSIYDENNELIYAADRVHLNCPLDLRNYKAYRTWIDPNSGGASGGVTGTLSCCWPTHINSEGIVTNWISDGSLQFKNGLLVGMVH